MTQTAKILNGVPVFELEEVVIGSQFTFAVYVEKLVSIGPDVWEPYDFTGKTLKADIKLKPADEILPDAALTCTPRAEPGWVDLAMDGTVTALLLKKTYEASLKVWPIGEPEHGDTLAVLHLPMKYKATR